MGIGRHGTDKNNLTTVYIFTILKEQTGRYYLHPQPARDTIGIKSLVVAWDMIVSYLFMKLSVGGVTNDGTALIALESQGGVRCQLRQRLLRQVGRQSPGIAREMDLNHSLDCDTVFFSVERLYNIYSTTTTHIDSHS